MNRRNTFHNRNIANFAPSDNKRIVRWCFCIYGKSSNVLKYILRRKQIWKLYWQRNRKTIYEFAGEQWPCIEMKVNKR